MSLVIENATHEATMSTEVTTIQRAYKVKLYPNAEQLAKCYRFAGYARFAYNWGLAYAKEQYEATGKTPGWMDIKKQFNAIKYNEYAWTSELLQRPAEEAIRDLGKAFQNFWRDCKKESGKKAKYPHFKSRYSPKSFRLYHVTIEHGRIKLPGLEWVTYRQPGYIPTEHVKYLGVTVSERGGSWWASVQVEQAHEPQRATGEPVGVDLGIKQLAYTSDGIAYDNPNGMKTYLKRLKRLQRKLSRQEKGSSNYRKTKRAIAKLHFKIACIRQNATHSASADITRRYATADERPTVIVLEDLNVSGMTKNHHLAMAVSDANMREMRRQIEYKAGWGGTDVIYADRFYPSSKTCSVCGVVNGDLTLSDRVFQCPACGAELDRDYNAARNLALLAE